MVTNATIKAISAVLDLDAGATPSIKQAVTRLLHDDVPRHLEESSAAKFIDVSQTTLYKWRNGQWENQPHAFCFATWTTPTNEVRYSVKELEAYNLLRRIECTRKNPQPDITREKLEHMMKLIEEQIVH